MLSHIPQRLHIANPALLYLPSSFYGWYSCYCVVLSLLSLLSLLLPLWSLLLLNNLEECPAHRSGVPSMFVCFLTSSAAAGVMQQLKGHAPLTQHITASCSERGNVAVVALLLSVECCCILGHLAGQVLNYNDLGEASYTPEASVYNMPLVILYPATSIDQVV
jgi:hypothetical protein